jgi:uncharacterized membrane protein YgdD (TMEM256/DUF423 family)
LDLRILLAAALLGGAGVGLGAFGAHALRTRLAPDLLAAFETGVRYQMYHALALFGVSVLAPRVHGTVLPAAAAWCFVAGTLVFSGSLYVLAVTGNRRVGAVTPIGGLALLAGWLLLVVTALRVLTVSPAVP